MMDHGDDGYRDLDELREAVEDGQIPEEVRSFGQLGVLLVAFYLKTVVETCTS
jgi:hypothetical protein